MSSLNSPVSQRRNAGRWQAFRLTVRNIGHWNPTQRNALASHPRAPRTAGLPHHISPGSSSGREACMCLCLARPQQTCRRRPQGPRGAPCEGADAQPGHAAEAGAKPRRHGGSFLLHPPFLASGLGRGGWGGSVFVCLIPEHIYTAAKSNVNQKSLTLTLPLA